MATLNTARTAAGLSTGGIYGLFARIVANVAGWHDARVTRKSLSRLSARELEDIGLSYGDIDTIAERRTR